MGTLASGATSLRRSEPSCPNSAGPDAYLQNPPAARLEIGPFIILGKHKRVRFLRALKHIPLRSAITSEEQSGPSFPVLGTCTGSSCRNSPYTTRNRRPNEDVMFRDFSPLREGATKLRI